MKLIGVLPKITDDHGASATSSPKSLVAIAQAAEAAGFHGVAVTDHPFPRLRGDSTHSTWDPFTLLGAIAGQTDRIHLAALAIVMPYRNPFLVANAARTLDHVAPGRFILGIGAGYDRGEFGALGADYEDRNLRTDEGIRAMRAAWTGEELHETGAGWRADGNQLLPVPVTRPHPPVWVGGNSRAAMRRAATLGDAWIPILKDSVAARATASRELPDLAALRRQLEVLHGLEHEVGRSTPLAVALIRPAVRWPIADHAAMAEEDRELEESGVTTSVVFLAGDSTARICDGLEAWGERRR
jgi:probable F420-dependent oxidoreductase